MHLPFTSSPRVLADLAAATPDARQTPWLLCVAEQHGESVTELLALLRENDFRVCGGVFPGLIANGVRIDSGLLAIPLASESRIFPVELRDSGPHWLQPPPEPADAEIASSLILIDCMAPGISGLLEEIYDRYGNQLRHVGAGAGYRDLRSVPSVFTEVGFIPHGGLLVLSPRRASVHVRHGWSRVRGPFIATRTRGNVIQELNWEPAGAFYRAQVAELAPELATRPVFPDIGAIYPLCIGKEGSEDVMRDPMHINAAGELVVLSDVPENAVMYLAHGNRDSLAESARLLARECGEPDNVEACFISSCFSRALMLGDDFPQELATVSEALARFSSASAEGVLALGEIAANGGGNVEFYNKTLVVALCHR